MTLFAFCGACTSATETSVRNPTAAYELAKAKHIVYDDDDGTHLRNALRRAVQINGLPVSVATDSHRIPHLAADTAEALFFGQGFVHAYYRLWQMETVSRTAEGRLAEVNGVGSAAIDRAMNAYDINSGAVRSAEKFLSDARTRTAALSYVAGVNAWIEQLTPETQPIEFSANGVTPRRYSVDDVARVITQLFWSISDPVEELKLSRTRADVSARMFDQMFPWPGSTKRLGVFSNGNIPTKRKTPAIVLRPDEIPIDILRDAWTHNLPNTGSNAIVIAGDATTSGDAIVANDFHMNFRLPVQFFPMQLAGRDFNAIGSSLPGAPGILSGTNGKIAWAYVASMGDHDDWFRIQTNPQNPDEYLWNGAWKKFEMRNAELKIRAANSSILRLRKSAAGPMVETIQTPKGPIALAYRWKDDGGRNYLIPFVDRLRASSATECGAADLVENSGSQLLSCVDRKRQAGVWVVGALIKRPAHQDPRVVMNAQADRDLVDGKTFYAAGENPRSFPANTPVAVANQYSGDSDARVYVGWNFAPSDRATRLAELLREKKKWNVEDVMRIQSDILNPRAQRLRNLFAQAAETFAKSTEVRYANCAGSVAEILNAWNLEVSRESSAQPVFAMWSRRAENILWGNALGDLAVHKYPTTWDSAEFFEKEPDSAIWNLKGTPAVETRKEVLEIALRQLCDRLQQTHESPSTLKWSSLYPVKFQWIPPTVIDPSLVVPADGSGETLFSQRGNHGSAYRSVISLGETVKFWAITAGGVSGDSKSSASLNWFPTWARREFFEVPYMTREQIRDYRPR